MDERMTDERLRQIERLIDRAKGVSTEEEEELLAEAKRARAESASLRAFKVYVHKRLDDAGVPVDPESPHKAAGCRIGGRMDVVLGESASLRARMEELEKEIEATRGHIDSLCDPMYAIASFSPVNLRDDVSLVANALGDISRALAALSPKGPETKEGA